MNSDRCCTIFCTRSDVQPEMGTPCFDPRTSVQDLRRLNTARCSMIYFTRLAWRVVRAWIRIRCALLFVVLHFVGTATSCRYRLVSCFLTVQVSCVFCFSRFMDVVVVVVVVVAPFLPCPSFVVRGFFVSFVPKGVGGYRAVNSEGEVPTQVG